MRKFVAYRLPWLICTWKVLGTLPSLHFYFFLLFISLFVLYIIYFIIFYSLLFFIILLGMDPKCMLTSTDLQMRRARCQHQLSFLLFKQPALLEIISY